MERATPYNCTRISVQVRLGGLSRAGFLLTAFFPEWASGDRSTVVQWSNANTPSSIYHKIALQSSPPNVESVNQAQDGTTYYAMSTVSTDHHYSPVYFAKSRSSRNLASHGESTLPTLSATNSRRTAS